VYFQIIGYFIQLQPRPIRLCCVHCLCTRIQSQGLHYNMHIGSSLSLQDLSAVSAAITSLKDIQDKLRGRYVNADSFCIVDIVASLLACSCSPQGCDSQASEVLTLTRCKLAALLAIAQVIGTHCVMQTCSVVCRTGL